MGSAVSLAAELVAAIATRASFEFEAWAQRIFRHQFERNAPYRAFCERRGVRPETVARWEDVPPVPAAAFRRAELACGPPEAIFLTSGTTDGAARGRHLVPHLAVYRASALGAFEHFMLPDGAHLTHLFLVPSPELRPDSSLARMCAWVGEAFGRDVEWLVGGDGLDVERLLARLADAERCGDALLLAGVTSAFVQLFDVCAARRLAFRLGPGSRVMDTGGTKGPERRLSRAGFLRACWTVLGVAGYCCVNEYGMTELCSQRYDSVLRDRFDGRGLEPRRLLGPPWLRTRILDPDTLEPVRPGEIGLLCHHDLANVGSVSVVLTEDLGRAVAPDGIEVTGRAAGAAPRGCGLLLAELGLS